MLDLRKSHSLLRQIVDHKLVWDAKKKSPNSDSSTITIKPQSINHDWCLILILNIQKTENFKRNVYNTSSLLSSQLLSFILL